MGLRLSTDEDKVCLFDSVTDWAFGPVFNTETAADRFLEWASEQGTPDVRALLNVDLSALWDRYCAETEHPCD